MKNLILICLLVMTVLVGWTSSGICATSNYQLYHIAARDYNGNGNFDYNGDVIRYGFTFNDLNTETGGWYAKAYDSSGKFLQGKMIGSSMYNESDGVSSWQSAGYWRANFDVNGIETVKLYNAAGIEQASHAVTLPDIGAPMSVYNGHNPLSVSWVRDGDGVLISWDSIAFPNSDSSYRLSLDHWSSTGNYSILSTIEYDQTNMWLPDTLLGVVDFWNLQFQERFENEGLGENFSWLRSYSGMIKDCDFSTSSVPIPGSALLLFSGLFGLSVIRRKIFK